MMHRALFAAALLSLGLTLSGCSMCDGWFWHKSKSCGDSAEFAR